MGASMTRCIWKNSYERKSSRACERASPAMFGSIVASRGTGPRATVTKTLPHTVGRGPVPRHPAPQQKNAGDRRIPERVKPTPVVRDRQIPNGACSGEPALQGIGPTSVVREHLLPNGQDLAILTYRGMRADRKKTRGTGPRATVIRAFFLTVGRGPVPRHAAIAGDRPPRYVPLGVFFIATKNAGGTSPPRYVIGNYFPSFTSPNVRNCRFAADTGPRNKRIDNICGLPANETSSN